MNRYSTDRDISVMNHCDFGHKITNHADKYATSHKLDYT
jgi:hypothetical protein